MCLTWDGLTTSRLNVRLGQCWVEVDHGTVWTIETFRFKDEDEFEI